MQNTSTDIPPVSWESFSAAMRAKMGLPRVDLMALVEGMRGFVFPNEATVGEVADFIIKRFLQE